MKQLHPRAVWLFFISYIWRWIFVAVFAGLLLISTIAENAKPSGLLSYLWWLLVVIPVFLVLVYIWARLSYRFYRYELTENGFRKELGVIWKKYVTIPYDRIQNVDIYRGVIARILGLSDLHIQTAGMSNVGKHGMRTEGRLPGLSKEEAERLRDELIQRARQYKNQGL